MVELTRKRFAELCCLTPPRINQLVEEGVITRSESGKYDLNEVSRYIEFIRKESDSESNFKDLLEREKYREKKRENDLAEDLVAPVDVIREVVEKGVVEVVAVLETLPLLMKRQFPELTGDQITLVKTAVAECRNSMADVKVKLDDE